MLAIPHEQQGFPNGNLSIDLSGCKAGEMDTWSHIVACSTGHSIRGQVGNITDIELIFWDSPGNKAWQQLAAPVPCTKAGRCHHDLWKVWATMNKTQAWVTVCQCTTSDTNCTDNTYEVCYHIFADGMNYTHSHNATWDIFLYNFLGEVWALQGYAFLDCSSIKTTKLQSILPQYKVEVHECDLKQLINQYSPKRGALMLVKQPRYVIMPAKVAMPWAASPGEAAWKTLTDMIRREKREALDLVFDVVNLAISAFQEFQIQQLYDQVGYIASQLKTFMDKETKAWDLQARTDKGIQGEISALKEAILAVGNEMALEEVLQAIPCHWKYKPTICVTPVPLNLTGSKFPALWESIEKHL
ncbi:uncharacterized protein [Petaurus breviceps papuanus]|uniref:uncharacterized protein n=1 Tax=Petaurus breviceps papuanus TaxID=3040969 RepID=UPI0036DF4051